MMEYSVLVVAAGKKAGEGESYEKVHALFNGSKRVLDQTVSIFLEDEKCKQIVVVTSPADMQTFVKTSGSGKILFVKGGKTRQESVLIGLTAVSEDIVLIHDGTRPWLTHDLIDKLVRRMKEEEACILAVPTATAVHRVENGYVVETYPSEETMLSQTPQAFQTSFIINCYQKAIQQGLSLLDDSAVVAAVSDSKIAIEEGDIRNTRFILKDINN
ncbi:2-C-methyl-D-erythritol 4-phosphate cytidylyltransferase [Erysipelothrix sp. HDW6A]|uniref:IspD/TarI family cytidylyltransferase n=1 Tax=Erysipelothrix sp. HDW6A TaxID=2714928 RepID=UPI001F112301|nr:2-C-methyl-D-erythritol 4-phosphate cytidylyltransferase [Erysipelothrix sp. HDW6A]